MWLSLAFAAPFVAPAPSAATYVDEGACAAACTDTCATSEATGAVHCVSAEEALLREAEYLCASACDGGCARGATGVTCFPGGTVGYARAAVRLRSEPSTTATVARTLVAGTPIPTLGRQEDWIRTDGGWVHGDFVASTWVGPPDPSDGYGLAGWPVAVTADGRSLVEVLDWGHQGAVDGPLLVLCAHPLAKGEPSCLRLDSFEGSTPTDQLAFMWNQHGSQVQDFLEGSRRAALVEVTAAEAGLVPHGDERGLLSVTRGDATVWEAQDPVSSRGAIRGLHRLEDRLLVAVVVRNLDGCCDQTAGLILPWVAP